MRVTVCAVGRLRAGAQFDLIKDYVSRFDRTGRALGLGPLDIVEVDAKKGGVEAEAGLLRRSIPVGAVTCVLDERGKVMTSPEFATRLGRWRDDGRRDAAFVIGGADGTTDKLRDMADMTLSFGAMVWPHMLARLMLVEQLYRAASILAGAPYHRT